MATGRDADQRTGRMWRMSGRGNGGAMGRNDPNNEPREMKWNGHLDCICCGSRGSSWLGWAADQEEQAAAARSLT